VENNSELIQENVKMRGQIAKLTTELINSKSEIKNISELYNKKSVEIVEVKEHSQLQAETHSNKL
jgi:hypothetical protein